ncbi:hypothetical protein TSUD_152940 [Trifolium subterraneum]|uniref:Leucine-rich repeat-containing N-terminal plant-type domain-containing protein n=1 Tax=Trifolium subterraneum TaxID=3900 RepID=A0A2Z6NKC7_TRISU|nr:hypothetical protein TSUD_152940 [Trifolium subterraneum]
MSSNEHRLVQCNEKDQETLLIFKKGINASYDQIPSWSAEKDCCVWEGVHCDNITGRVIELHLSEQGLEGEMNLSILQLEFLSYLDLSFNEFDVINIPATLHNFTHPSNLFYLDLYDSFRHMDNLDWLSPLSSLKYLNLSRMDLHKETNWLQAVNTLPSLLELRLSYCNLNNFIINQSIEFSNLSSLLTLHLYGNNFTSQLPSSFFNFTKDLTYLNFQGSNIHGGLPNLSPMVESVDLSYNSFSGSIPRSWKNLKDLIYINTWSNKLSGEALVHLSDWTQLTMMNLGANEFSGTIPINMSQNLNMIILRANQFEGTIPTQLFDLPSLFHLDLAHNKLSGSMPKCAYNLTQMVTFHVDSTPYFFTLELFTKGQDYYVEHANPIRRTIDLSANNLSGELPLKLFQLFQVQTLNLSHNNFIGTIPKTIGGMKYIESLDLSNNKLSGEIPHSMALLNFLEYLNLSCNNFHGKIPIGTQLQSFNASSYIGNPKLCGAPLNNCTTEKDNEKSRGHEDGDSITESLYLGMGVGFAAGFWGICGSLFLIRKWRHACYRFVDGVGDKLYVTLMVKLNSFCRN